MCCGEMQSLHCNSLFGLKEGVFLFQIKWIWKNMEGFKKRYIFALCSTFVLAFLGLGNSFITSNIVENVFNRIGETGVVQDENFTQLIKLVVLLVGFTLFRTSLNYISVITYETCSQKLVYGLRKFLYANMQTQDTIFYGRNRTGDIMTRLTGDLEMVRHTVCWVLRMMIECIVLFLSASICFLIVDWLLAVSLLIVTPVIFMLTKTFSRRARPLYIDIRQKLSELNTAAQENIAGNRVVKAFSREDYEKSRFDTKNKAYMDASIKAPMMWLRFAPYIEGLSQALSVAILLVGGIFLIMGRITIGEFVLFNSLSWTLSNPMRMLGFLINDIQRFFVSANKVIELYYARSTITTRDGAVSIKSRLKGDIKFEHVSLKIRDTQVLKDISIHIQPGETLAIMGPTGAGKTSLVNLIPRLMDPSKGEISIDGVAVNLYDVRQLRSSIGIATQDVFLFSDTLDGNIAYGNTKLSEEEVKRFAKIADVDFAEKLTDGYDTIIGERGTGLSGGQKQRIALARALAVKPSVLILDDTTSALDMETEKYIQAQLANLEFQTTKIIVAQRISTTKAADKVLILEDGEISDYGTHDELISRPGYYREVYRLQNGIEDDQEGGI